MDLTPRRMNVRNEQNSKSTSKFKLINTDNYQAQNFIAGLQTFLHI